MSDNQILFCRSLRTVLSWPHPCLFVAAHMPHNDMKSVNKGRTREKPLGEYLVPWLPWKLLFRGTSLEMLKGWPPRARRNRAE